MATPKLTKPIPPQIVNELAAFGPLKITDCFDPPLDPATWHFSASLANEASLPKGLICTEDGFVTGIPAKNTSGDYDVLVVATQLDETIEIPFLLTIKPTVVEAESGYIDQLKAQVWRALDQKLPAPDLSGLYEGTVSIMDVYYLLERWASLIIWNANDLSAPTKPVPLDLKEAGEHYQIYDRGSCLIAAPKDLFSQERTLVDAIKAARAIAGEVYKREWVVEFAGFDKMVRAAWVEFQHLEDKFGREVEIRRYEPGLKELRIYSEEQKEVLLRRAENR